MKKILLVLATIATAALLASCCKCDGDCCRKSDCQAESACCQKQCSAKVDGKCCAKEECKCCKKDEIKCCKADSAAAVVLE